MTGAQIERERTKQRQLELARLSKDDYQEWKRKLGALDLSRESIKQAMGFAFDKIESAEEVKSHHLIYFVLLRSICESWCVLFSS